MQGKPATQNELSIYIYILIYIYKSMCVCIMYYFNYLDRFSNNPHVLNFMKTRQVGAEFFLRVDRRTDITKLIVAFRNVMKSSKKFKSQPADTLKPKTLF
jgi:hypothetical protein